MLCCLAFQGVVTPARAYEIPTTPSGSWTGSNITSGSFTFGAGTQTAESGTYAKTTPSGLTVTITVDGTFPPGSGSYFFAPGAGTNTTGMNPTAAGTSPGPFTTLPVLPNATNPLWMLDSVFTCKTTVPAATTCTGIGNVTVTFTDPTGGQVKVVNPKIHVTRLGGTVGAMELGAGWQTNSVGLSLTPAATATLAVQNGNEFYGNPTPPGTTLNVECGVSATTTAGCGSIQVNGTASTLNFVVNAYRTTAGGNAWGDGADGFFFDMSFDEDFGGAPASYEGGGTAAAHLLSDLRLGSTVSAEKTATAADANGGATGTGLFTTSPLAAAAGAAPGDDNDGVASFPALTTDLIGQTYTVSPTLSGASRSGKLCGWIDFDRSGTFASTEGVCTNFSAGATSAPLAWTVPAATTAGPTYARFRTTYDTAMTTSSFNGLFSSGEVEDYLVHIKPVVKIIKTLSPVSDTGTVNLTVNGTAFASAVGNGGTTGFKSVYHTNSPDVTVATDVSSAPITGVALGETAAGATVLANYATTSACVDGAGTTVTPGGTPSAPTVTIPASITGASANGKAQTIICTLTNARLASVKLQKKTLGNFGGPFTFAQTNLSATPGGISTTAVNTVAPASPTAITVSALNTAVTLTESVFSGYTPSAASCTDANAANTGNSGSLGSLGGNILTLASGVVKAGADFTCVFTNVKTPTVKLQKTTLGGFGGPFSFSQTNLAATPAAITTSAAATPTPAAPAATAVATTGTAVTVTEGATTGFFISGVSCTDANSAITGNSGTFGTLAGSVLTIPAAKVVNGADFVCVFSNTKAVPQVTVVKSASPAGPVAAGTVVTYSYKVTNTGNVAMTNVKVVDAANGSGTAPVPGNETLTTDTAPLGDSSDAAVNGIYDVLGVGDVATFTSTYTVTQHDIDFLQ